jgi:hypothetical protein
MTSNARASINWARARRDPARFAPVLRIQKNGAALCDLATGRGKTRIAPKRLRHSSDRKVRGAGSFKPPV